MAPASASFSNLSYLANLLRARLTFHHVYMMQYPLHYRTADELITTHRFILILEGESLYTVDGVTSHLTPGQLIFVPAWTQRFWRAHARNRCRHMWCEFSDDGPEVSLHTLFINNSINRALERASLQRMIRHWPGPRLQVPLEPFKKGVVPNGPSPRDQLQIEGELKAMMARFWPDAQPVNPAALAQPLGGQKIHPDLRQALLWLNEHFLEPNALQKLYSEIQLSPNHFRFLFHRDLQCNPQSYLMRLRLRRARTLVLGSELPFKQIAAMTGFSDPLFFSRQYHLFFQTSPRADRKQPQS